MPESSQVVADPNGVGLVAAPQKVIVSIPNSMVLTNNIINYSKNRAYFRDTGALRITDVAG